MILIDSDHLSVILDERDARREPLIARLDQESEPAWIPIVVVEEHLRSWLAQIRRATDVQRQIVPYLKLTKLIA